MQGTIDRRKYHLNQAAGQFYKQKVKFDMFSDEFTPSHLSKFCLVLHVETVVAVIDSL